MMVKQGSGAIVCIGSNTAERAIRDRTAYVASKGAIDALVRAMAVELGPQGIRVNCVVAGYINTDRWDVLDPKIAERRRANIPLGQEAHGKDIADVVMFMASDKASKINGARLMVDGGCTVQLFPTDCDG
jgi:NAD(P)-dependent dehydrogenase (short-subunit alcohol dehydrogenase family)